MGIFVRSAAPQLLQRALKGQLAKKAAQDETAGAWHSGHSVSFPFLAAIISPSSTPSK